MGFLGGDEDFWVSVERLADEAVLFLGGELDFGCTLRLRESVAQALEGSPRQVVFDVAALTFIDSSGLGVAWCASGLGSRGPPGAEQGGGRSRRR